MKLINLWNWKWKSWLIHWLACSLSLCGLWGQRPICATELHSGEKQFSFISSALLHSLSATGEERSQPTLFFLILYSSFFWISGLSSCEINLWMEMEEERLQAHNPLSNKLRWIPFPFHFISFICFAGHLLSAFPRFDGWASLGAPLRIRPQGQPNQSS